MYIVPDVNVIPLNTIGAGSNQGSGPATPPPEE